MRVTIFGKILIGFAVLLSLTLFMGGYYVLTLNHTRAAYTALLKKNAELLDDARTMQVVFETQVQEWKNILLRGGDPEMLAQYTASFLKAYNQVQAIGARVAASGLQPNSQALMAQFLTEHRFVQEKYLAALDIFKADRGGHAHAADQAVKGIDRVLTSLLDTFVAAILAEANQNSLRLNNQAKTVEKISLGVLAGTFILAASAAFVTARKISRPLLVLAGALREVARGNLTIPPLKLARDEIGDLARSTQTLIAYIREVAGVTEKIANMDLQVAITPKSDQDVLNQSLSKMATNLRNMLAENQKAIQEIEQQTHTMQQQNWLKDGISQLSAQLAGENSLKAVCQKAINFTARHVAAGKGVLYTYNAKQQFLELQSSFAFTARDHVSGRYRLGEGVIGQVALERTPILLTHLTRAESLITTGVTSAAPVNTYTLPLLHEADLYGVIELAAFEPFDASKQEFLAEAHRVIATALFSATQREMVQELLRVSQEMTKAAERTKAEAQRQAEDAQSANVRLEEQQQRLQQQNEEFRQMNAQLQEQQERLQQTEQSLRESEARTRAIVETAVDGIITIDERGTVESFNAAAARMFGYAPADVLGRNVTLLMPAPHRENHAAYLTHYLKTGQKKIIGIGREVQGKRQDGTLFPLRLAVSEMNLSGRRMFTGVIHDLTELKQAEAALQKLKQ